MTPQETIAHLQSQLDECRKVVAAKDEALRKIAEFTHDAALVTEALALTTPPAVSGD